MKTVNTRIKNKLDILENWELSNIVLLPGELAVVSVDESDVKIKVGDGVNLLSDLSYIHAMDFDYLSGSIDIVSADVEKINENKSKFKYISISESNFPIAPDLVGGELRDIIVSSDAIYDNYTAAPIAEPPKPSYLHKFNYPTDSGTIATEESTKQKIEELSNCLSTYFNGLTFDGNAELINSVSGLYATVGKLFELFGGTYIPPVIN